MKTQPWTFAQGLKQRQPLLAASLGAAWLALFQVSLLAEPTSAKVNEIPAVASSVVQNDRAFLESIETGASAPIAPVQPTPQKVGVQDSPVIAPPATPESLRQTEPVKERTAPIAAQVREKRTPPKTQLPPPVLAQEKSRKRTVVVAPVAARKPAPIAERSEEAAVEIETSRVSVRPRIVRREQLQPTLTTRIIEVRRAEPVERDEEDDDDDRDHAHEAARDSHSKHVGLFHRIFNDND